MTSRDFCYWLQGFLEIQEDSVSLSITPQQVNVLRKHLNLVFKHEIDPSMGDSKHQQELNKIHNKPTLSELGKIHGFEVTENIDPQHGKQPHPGWVCSPLHGWYDPKEGVPKC